MWERARFSHGQKTEKKMLKFMKYYKSGLFGYFQRSVHEKYEKNHEKTTVLDFLGSFVFTRKIVWKTCENATDLHCLPTSKF